MSVTDQLAQLIQQWEGFGTENAPSITVGNNPGAIQAGSYATTMGAIGTSPNGTAIFPSLQAGTNALTNLINSKLNQGATTPDSFIKSYEGDPTAALQSTQNYIQHIAAGFGIGTQDSFPGMTGAATGANTAAPVTPAGGSAASLPNIGSILSGASTAVSVIKWWSNLSLGQIVALIIGIGLIIGGIFFLRPVQTFVEQSVSRGKRVAGLFS